MTERLVVLHRLEELLSSLYPSLRKFPKAERFTLAQRIENTSLECIDLVVWANLEKASRKQHLMRARVVAERLQILIRIARAQDMIDSRHYELYSEKLTEISKMMSGWLRVTQ